MEHNSIQGDGQGADAIVETEANVVVVPSDANACSKVMARFVIISKLTFGVVEGDSFKRLCKYLQPQLIIPSRKTVAKDCFKLYRDEKLKLKVFFKSGCSRLALTTDLWTSFFKTLGYVSLTAHFIDTEKKYQKKILSFSFLPNHTGDAITQIVEESLRVWDLKNISAVTINNASSNDVAAKIRDFLSIPISIEALESIFSGRVRKLDSYRSSLSPNIVETLICCENWLKPIEEFEINEGDFSEGNQESMIWCWEAANGVGVGPAGVSPATRPSV